MSFIKVGTENSASIELHYNDHGAGKPIVLIHGYPLDGSSWERQERVLLEHGYRCTGEVTRYLGTYGSAGISKAVLIGSIPPYLLQADDNPHGVPKDVFEGFKQAIVADRYAFLDSFLANLYNSDVSMTERPRCWPCTAPPTGSSRSSSPRQDCATSG
jgi:non-heme chloroperoxidase